MTRTQQGRHKKTIYVSATNEYFCDITKFHTFVKGKIFLVRHPRRGLSKPRGDEDEKLNLYLTNKGVVMSLSLSFTLHRSHRVKYSSCISLLHPEDLQSHAVEEIKEKKLCGITKSHVS